MRLSVPAVIALVLALPLAQAALLPGVAWVIEPVAERAALFSGGLEVDSAGVPRIIAAHTVVGGGVDLYHHVLGSAGWSSSLVAEDAFMSSFELDADDRAHVVVQGEVPPVGDPLYYMLETGSGWVTEPIGVGGFHPDLALSPAGIPHIVFMGRGGLPHNLLHHAQRDAAGWSITPLQGTGFPSIAVDSQGRPHIATYGLLGGNQFGQVYYFTRDASGAWTSEQIPGCTGSDNDITIDANDEPHIACRGAFLYHAHKTVSGWVVESTGSSFNFALEPSIEVGPEAIVHIVARNNFFADSTGSHPWYLTKIGGRWTRISVDQTGNGGGLALDLALDAQDNPHLSFVHASTCDCILGADTPNNQLRYATTVEAAPSAHTAALPLR